MSKAEILAELLKLSPEDRQEIRAKLTEFGAGESLPRAPLCAHSSNRDTVPIEALATREEWKDWHAAAKRSANKWLAENP
ncbi:MAG: hypothetical protein ABSE73_11925 [Planctomycetota bacterium]